MAVSDFKPFSVSINITNNDNTAEVYRVKFISHPITVGASLHLYSTVWSLSGVWFYCCGLLPYMWMVWTNACLSQLHQTLHINVYPSWVKHWKFSSWPVQQEFLRNRLISMWTKTCFVKSFSWQRWFIWNGLFIRELAAQISHICFYIGVKWLCLVLTPSLLIIISIVLWSSPGAAMLFLLLTWSGNLLHKKPNPTFTISTDFLPQCAWQAVDLRSIPSIFHLYPT